MIARACTLVCLIALALSLAAFGAACGKYGPPVRVAPRAEAVQAAQAADNDEEDLLSKETKP